VSLPDTKAVLIGWLSTLPELDGVVVAGRVPEDYDGSQRVVRVTRAGGHASSLPYWRDNAYVEIDAFGPDEASAWDLIAIAREAVLNRILDADLSPFGACVMNAIEHVGPQWFDEPDYPPAGRFLIQTGVTIRAHIA
jgi:hypothetical protein